LPFPSNIAKALLKTELGQFFPSVISSKKKQLGKYLTDFDSLFDYLWSHAKDEKALVLLDALL
jgi:hypothetical protein